MILPDVNVLIYVFRVDSRQHDRYKAWLEEVVRICSHPRIFIQPSDEALVSQPAARRIVPGDRHRPLFRKLCVNAKANGNLVQDAWNAALAIEAGCEWITTDRDYSRVTGLNWRSPF